jgi:hypothetical protein
MKSPIPQLSAALLLAGFAAVPLSAQPKKLELGLGVGMANTDQNATALGGTLTWNAWTGTAGGFPVTLSLRGILDAEAGVHDFKAHLDYYGADNAWADSVWIADNDGLGTKQRPEGDDLWQPAGWDFHGALYGTVRVDRIFLGGGFASNGLDATNDWSWLLGGYVTERTELDLELLPTGQNGKGRWRFRFSFGFWQLGP